MLQIFLKSLLIGYSGAVMPGSMLTYTIDKSMKHGAKSGLIISIGHSLLELILVLLLLFGVGKYLSSSIAQILIGIIGGAVLVFFGVTMLRDVYMNRLKLEVNEAKTQTGNGNMLLGGAVISASNPYFIFWWAVVGLGLIMEAYNKFGLIGVVAFYIGHIISDISWYGLISSIVSMTRHIISLKVYRIIVAVLGVCLMGFGGSFLYSSFSILL